jgi:ParB-like chromosome segregation protein Spo0J
MGSILGIQESLIKNEKGTRRLISKLKPHPHQNLVPAMSAEDYHNLLEGIRHNGILQPINIAYNNVVLDGHHRIKAVKELGIREEEVRIP